jgi:hypothetical protein
MALHKRCDYAKDFPRKGAKMQSAAAFLRIFFATLRLCVRNIFPYCPLIWDSGLFCVTLRKGAKKNGENNLSGFPFRLGGSLGGNVSIA